MSVYVCMSVCPSVYCNAIKLKLAQFAVYIKNLRRVIHWALSDQGHGRFLHQNFKSFSSAWAQDKVLIKSVCSPCSSVKHIL